MSSSDLQALFSNLRPRSTQDRTSASPAPGQTSRPVSSAFLTHPGIPATPPPPSFHSSSEHAGASNFNQPATTAPSATAQNLLNLLNFGNAHTASSGATPGLGQDSHEDASQHHASAKSISASDLVARIMSPSTGGASFNGTPTPGSTFVEYQTPSTRNPLLDLLNKQASAQASFVEGTATPRAQDEALETNLEGMHQQENEAELSAVNVRQESPLVEQSTPIGTPSHQKPLFTYTNPFHALNAARSQTPQTPNPQSDTSAFSFSATPVVEAALGVDSPTTISARKKLTPKLRSQRSGTSPNPESPVLSNAVETNIPETLPSISLRQKQPQVETPAAAFNKEITETEAIQAGVLERPSESVIENGTAEGQEGSGEWEDEDELPEKPTAERIVPVYNFPIKAFVSITLQLGAGSNVGIREGSVMPISRLKKEFDQLDRSLAAATSKYITYALSKTGGLRIIRQDDGGDRSVFKNTHDRIFNVAIGTTAATGPASDTQIVLGTGISGAVYYATVSKEGNDLFEKKQLESESLIFPPWPQADENTAGGVLKTRAKRSSRHPEYFAIGRGKSIHIVWPATALSPRYGISNDNRRVDVEKFYQDRPLQIQTGKAGKDFTFSEDDSMIVSLDKTGRLRFWDIRRLVDEENATATRIMPETISTPVLSLSTASPAEKSWPTSVLFVDKARPYIKGGALRYVLVGLRQNHTLQLWDIALGKAVQEINFPHDSETDGICSVSYHSGSGIIVVGHPTRNSIFFIHLSAPRYTLTSQLSQAAYVSRVAAKDSDLPKPESTACMSGIREISFAERGELRSVELLHIQKSSDSAKSVDSMKVTDELSTLFELYVFHSRGVSCLAINKQDLGWNADNKVIHSIDAEKGGLLTLKELKLGSVIEEPARSASPMKEIPQPVKSSKKKAKKAAQTADESLNESDAIQPPLPVAEPEPAPVAEPTPVDTPVPKESKKNKKKAAAAAQTVSQILVNPEPRSVSPTKAVAPQMADGNLNNGDHAREITSRQEVVSSFSTEAISKEVQKIEQAISADFQRELKDLYQNISSDRTAQEKVFLTRHEAILRVVSDTLATNVEKSLSGIVADQIQKAVLPTLLKTTSDQMVDITTKSVEKAISREMDSKLPKAVATALQSPHLSRTISDAVSQKLAKQVETQFTDLMTKTLTPAFKSIAQSAAEQAASETESRLTAQIHQLQLQSTADNEKIDRLSQVLQGMAETLQAMSDSQVAFQGQILRERQQLALSGSSNAGGISRQVSTARASPAPAVIARPTPVKPKSMEQIELEEISEMMNAGKYEEGTIKWLQSSQPGHLFDEIFVRFTPEYLATDVSPLVAFSVAVTVANSLGTNLERRLEWISTAFDSVDPLDAELTDLTHHAPALISSIVQKLESLYMTLAERDPGHVALRAIPSLAKKARDMKVMFSAKLAAA